MTTDERSMSEQQLIKTYSSITSDKRAFKKFQRDAAQLAVQGWRVQSQSTMRSRFSLNWYRNTVSVVYAR